MIKQLIYVTFILIISASCSKDYTGCSGPPDNCVKIYYIKGLLLNDSNSNWLNTYKNKNLILLKNNHGFIDTFLITKPKTSKHDVYLKSDYVDPWEKCCISGSHQWYCNVESEICHLKSYFGTVDISLYRTKKAYFPTNALDSINLYNQPDLFYIYFDRKRFQFWPNTKQNFLNQRYYENYQLNNKTFSNVYEVLDTTASSSFVTIQAVYFNYQFGILGYALTNGDKWFLE